MVLRPSVSENELHHSGKIDMLSMYSAMLRFTMDAVDLKYRVISTNAGRTILDAIGAAAPAAEMIKVMIHFVLRG
jgi:hypothetical protein